MRPRPSIVLFALAAMLGAVSLCFAPPALAARISYQGGEPLDNGGPIGIEIIDEIPGTPIGAWPLPQVQLDGNVLNIYVQPYYNPAPTAISYTTYVQVAPLQVGDYQVNFYTKETGPFPSPTDYSLKATFTMTVLPIGAIQRTIEYYNAERGHYFLTANPIEMALLDSGVLPGWTKTGAVMWTYSVEGPVPATLLPVCRFYGRPEAGLDSHFFTASAAECLAVQQLWPEAWLLESPNVFYVVSLDPVLGGCPLSTDIEYRLFNNRPDINHRYMRDGPKGIELPSPIDAMVAQGWILEGPVWCSNLAQ